MAVAVATLPGATLWHDGQFEGRRVQLPATPPTTTCAPWAWHGDAPHHIIVVNLSGPPGAGPDSAAVARPARRPVADHRPPRRPLGCRLLSHPVSAGPVPHHACRDRSMTQGDLGNLIWFVVVLAALLLLFAAGVRLPVARAGW